MDYSTSKSRYILTTLAIIIVITAFILVGLNAWLNQMSGGISLLPDRYDEGYRDGYIAAREKLKALAVVAQPETSLLMTGIVQSVVKDGLTVKQTSLDTDPVVDGVPDVRYVILAKDAKIQKQGEKDFAAFEREMRDFDVALNTKTIAEPPSPRVYSDIKLSDLKTGDWIQILSASNLRLSETITATKVTLLLSQH